MTPVILLPHHTVSLLRIRAFGNHTDIIIHHPDDPQVAIMSREHPEAAHHTYYFGPGPNQLPSMQFVLFV